MSMSALWIISTAMVASTVFFANETQTVGDHWKTSWDVGMLVTLIAAMLYFYMHAYCVIVKQAPIEYRYTDWSLTSPLQMLWFYCTLYFAWRLLIGTVVMLAFSYRGEQSIIYP